MAIILRKLTNDTFRECIGLKVAAGQEDYVASNVFSLAEAQADGVSNPRAIYADEQMVGFIMYDFNSAEGRGYITRLMVDRRFQGNGYGRAAMQQVIDLFKANPDCREIYTSIHPENSVAEGLYVSLGFRLTGEMDDGEAVLLMDLC
jgi:diamine N-acetyltransferase